jgi:hypothetical protein
MVRYVADSGATHIVLKPPSSFADANSPALTKEHLIEFTSEASFASDIVSQFSMFLWPKRDGDESFRSKWQKIFEQPCIYPPPAGHPLSEAVA